jgi:hypothetical protein
MGMGLIRGLMAVDMLACGYKVNNMARENLHLRLALKKRAIGKMGNGLAGLPPND